MFPGGVLYDLCFQLHHPLMHFIFYLHIRRSGMRSSPLFDIRQDLCTHLLQGMFIHLFSAFCSLFKIDVSSFWNL